MVRLQFKLNQNKSKGREKTRVQYCMYPERNVSELRREATIEC